MKQRRFCPAIFPIKLFLVVGTTIAIYVLYRVWSIRSTQGHAFSTTRSISAKRLNVSSECQCIDQSTRELYDFCYASAFAKVRRGRRFSCEWLPILKELDLLEDSWADKWDQFPNVAERAIMVTAASQSHFPEELVLIHNIQQRFSFDQRVIFYDLGLDRTSVDLVRKLRNIEYRRFPFEKFPPHVRYLHEFRWKPLIIAESLKEFGAIWYVDSSIIFETGNLSTVYNLFDCWRNSVPWNASQMKRPICGKSPYLLHAFTGHGIFPVTHPDLYTFFPTDLNALKNTKCGMYEAGFVFALRTWDVRDLLKWYVLCALERGCGGPRGSMASCSFNAVDRYGKSAHCHRFDQSVINLLLAHRYNYNSYYWSSGVSLKFFDIRRNSKLTPQEFNQLRYAIV